MRVCGSPPSPAKGSQSSGLKSPGGWFPPSCQGGRKRPLRPFFDPFEALSHVAALHLRAVSGIQRHSAMLELAPDLSHLDRLLGDVLLEGEIARPSRAVVYRVHTGGAGGAGVRPLALKVALE